MSTRQQDSLERLEKRLSEGYNLIEERRAAGIDVTALEVFWLALLKQYEMICQEISTQK